MATKLGSRKRRKELPNTFATFVTAASGPTTVKRSPICNCKFGLATKSTPARFTRVTLTPKQFRNRISPNIFPFTSPFVIAIRRDTSCLSNCSQATLTRSPRKAAIASMSCKAATTSNLSPSRRQVSEEPISIRSSSWQTRENTNFRFIKRVISIKSLPNKAGFVTRTENC